MKIVHFHFGKEGGAERFFVHLVNAFAKRGVEQKVIIRPGRSWRSNFHESVEVKESHFRTASLDRVLLPFFVRSLIEKWKPDCVLGWMPKGAKLVPNISGPVKLVRLGDYPTSLRKFRNIDTVVCNTPGIARHVRDLGWQRGIEVISNFTDMASVPPVDRDILDTPKNAYVVSSSGRFVPRKGFDVLVRMLADRPDIYLWLIGGGEEEQNLKALATKLSVAERVRFAGWQKDPRPFIAASDCFAMASKHEPLGNVVLEAWAQGVPVISTRAEGPSWFMRDEENGLMVDIDDHNAFGRAVHRFRSDCALVEKIVEGGSQTLQKMFSEDAVVNAYTALIYSGRSLS
ncbi:glycosyltransferase [Aquamicrobium defluvii]|uniref:Glycosyltransferase involved in cell wall biosynthesis n=1 Tax=Aquamicrobium defluvii TaxID=69279 RepID=A0A011V308_9HYPH|nr:glycosyltransferase [Aquamicrobium defluvii]EXL02865.1 lipopolysaccharide biosynthesis protein [Aquamicrobium defluvii]EZQ13349.1 lipopolysaccharide biosynthesis protein [Halopseudomonas bauzanensis]TDR33226.1 glycosyltransferase involved in cell wall biosynthesis [Aquamicrobium defluvii]